VIAPALEGAERKHATVAVESTRKTPVPSAERARGGGGPLRPSVVPLGPPPSSGGLDVASPDDPLEHDADRAAEEVERAAGAPLPPASPPGDDGEPLSPSLRSYFESRLGLTLPHVRVRAGEEAAGAARAVGARAFTSGLDILFGHEEYSPETADGRALLAHELSHAVQNTRGAAPAVRREPKETKPKPGPAAGEGKKDPAVSEDIGAWPETTACIDPKFMVNTPDAVEQALQKCIDPKVAAEGKAHLIEPKLAKDIVLTDYKNRARQLLTFRLDAMRQWVDIVVRAQLLDKGKAKPKAESSLRKAAEQANELGKRLFERGSLVQAYDALIQSQMPPPGTPVNADDVTVGSIQWITTRFSHAQLQAYHKDIPDILPILQTLGSASGPTEEQVTQHIVEHTSKRDVLELGYQRLHFEGKYTYWGKHVTPSEEWTGRKYSEKEVMALGADWLAKLPPKAAADPVLGADEQTRRDVARQLLDLEPRGPADPREVGIPPGYNYTALRFVTGRLRDAAAAQMFDAQRALDDHLNRYPTLRLHVSNWAVLRNQFSGAYKPLIDPSDLTAEELPTDIDKLLSELDEAKSKIAKDEDLLFDDAAINVLGPLLKLYDSVDHEYGKYIAARFKSTRRWNQIIDGLLAIGSLIAFVIGSAVSGGLAAPFLIAGAAGAVVLAVRAEHRASYIESLRDAGIADLNAAAVARFSAWFEKALAVVSVISVLLRPLAASVRWVSRAVQAGRAAPQGIRIFPLYLPISAVDRALVQQWGTQLQRLLARAVELVDSGQGTTRWAQIHRGTGPLGGTALARGNAIHYEFYRLVDAARADFAPAQVALNQGRAFAGGTNAFSPLRPDVRILVPGSVDEAIFDATTVGEAGHALPYANYGWVTSVTELLYQ
jgi:hypothetical protein